MILLKDLPVDELQGRLASLGVTPALAARLQAEAIRNDAWLEPGPGISPRVLASVREASSLPRLAVVGKVVSTVDGFARYVFEGDGPGRFEAVRIPLRRVAGAEKYVVCVSSQVGCAQGCAFCRTGRMGFTRQLAAWEIVDQVVRVRADSPHPVGGVVFMGMGEPLLNEDAVLRSIRILREPCGMALSPKSITLSTVGVIPGIRRLAAEEPRVKLIVSLTSADPARRRQLMPCEAVWPTEKLIETVRGFHAATGQRVTFAWTMISGFNLRPLDARHLAELTRGMPIRLELIDVNDPTGRFAPPSPAELDLFRDALRAEGVKPVTRRYSGGQDIQAACGMLAGGGDR